MPQQIVITVKQAVGADWAAIVSAASAVVQAIAAGAAIIYSGKLARESAQREIAAEAASARRAEEAERAAARRADEADREAAVRAVAAEIAAHNEPIEQAIEIAERTRDAFASLLGDIEEREPQWELPLEVPRIALELRPALATLRGRIGPFEAINAADQIIEMMMPINFPFPQNKQTSLQILRPRHEAVSRALASLRQALRGVERGEH